MDGAQCRAAVGGRRHLLHRLKHVNAQLRVAHANLLQRLVLVAALRHVLLMQNVVARRFRLELRRCEISTQRLQRRNKNNQ